MLFSRKERIPPRINVVTAMCLQVGTTKEITAYHEKGAY
jgi:hypothetical protein